MSVLKRRPAFDCQGRNKRNPVRWLATGPGGVPYWNLNRNGGRARLLVLEWISVPSRSNTPSHRPRCRMTSTSWCTSCTQQLQNCSGRCSENGCSQCEAAERRARGNGGHASAAAAAALPNRDCSSSMLPNSNPRFESGSGHKKETSSQSCPAKSPSHKRKHTKKGYRQHTPPPPQSRRPWGPAHH